ncbi:MAG: ATP-binding cassette domain-containing protein [Tissierellia bacterium]|nr:ATP-binding cassette domain-containing protein [Tissierellia bacterium]MDD3226045.1 ATP-binding cassette domain-containing protein [Tissierellia bacterium]MDD3751589.1 ATP-binding cassette domain-containing protein [Tissierellia bacterium]MDD4045758.1 ATP-binding cassette domain-containing protein [Tissierellia bacterium]MDD4678070.1 ATP-binding cassette domain-containing protein [Tissierellia bacterium]
MVLLVENLSKSFGNNEVFHDISFSVNIGEIVCIRGKSGEGKTTLLRCLTSLETADKGSIKINNMYLCKEDNNNIKYAQKNELQAIRQEIGLVFQNFNLFPHMNIMENLMEAPLFLKNDTRENIKSRAEELLKSLELEGKEDSYPFQLSGGQQQRVAIARACMLNPSVLCFDEPTSALDDQTRGQISKIIKYLSSEGIAIIIVTHDNAFADEIAHRIITMKDGKITIEEQ